jgi:hypothetical protein
LAVEREGALISAVRLEIGGEQRRVRCQVVIDGSDRGDLLPYAGAPYRFGWEPQEQWGEPSAPSQSRLESEPFFREHPVQSPTWVVMGQLQSEHIPDGVGPAQLAEPFAQALNAFGLEQTLTYGRLPGGLVMLNWPLHGNDWHWGLERAFSADPTQEEQLDAEMQAHSLRFAEALIEASGGWLQLGEAFPAASGSPAPWLAAMPYWREGRRMIGRSTVIEQDLLPEASGPSIAPLPRDAGGALQSIAVGNYANDHHYPGPDWPLAPKSCRWGGRWSGTPFGIPYGALVSAELDNLLAADKAFSTSHMANGATRLQPTILNVGQAAGAAAALAVRSGITPADLPVLQLQQLLINDPLAPSAVLPLWDTPWHHPDWLLRQQSALAEAALGPASPQPAPAAPGELQLDAVVTAAPDGHFTISLNTPLGGRSCWPLITLEPELNQLLQSIDTQAAVQLRGHLNPWGPWFRATELQLAAATNRS